MKNREEQIREIAKEAKDSFVMRQKKIADNKGMIPWDGLYHGNRRVRAKIGESKKFTSNLDGWRLAPDEKDLTHIIHGVPRIYPRRAASAGLTAVF